MAKYYQVSSGKPLGEIYHWAVWVCNTKSQAESVRNNMESQINELQDCQKENWAWGPHVQEFESTTSVWPTHWNGFEEVKAPIWAGQQEVI